MTIGQILAVAFAGLMLGAVAAVIVHRLVIA